MFDLPGAKRVKRSRLFSNSSASSSSEALKDVEESRTAGKKSSKPGKGLNTSISDLESHSNDKPELGKEYIEPETVDYGFEYDFVDAVGPTSTTIRHVQSADSASTERIDPKGEDGISDEVKQLEIPPSDTPSQSYEFLLFKPTTKPASTSQQPTTTITIRSPTPDPIGLAQQGVGKITKPRPLSYYFTSSLAPTTQSRLQAEYSATAVSTSKLLQQSTSTAWPGTHLPWRIIHIPPSKLILHPSMLAESLSKTTSSPAGKSQDHPNRRPKPSKKRRIFLRRRAEARKAIVEQSKVDEVAEREKRTKRNREKKVKRKEREKRKRKKQEQEQEQEQRAGTGDGIGDEMIKDKDSGSGSEMED